MRRDAKLAKRRAIASAAVVVSQTALAKNDGVASSEDSSMVVSGDGDTEPPPAVEAKPGEPEKDKMTRVWTAGMSALAMGLNEQPGPTIDIVPLNASIEDLFAFKEGVVGSGGFGVCHAAKHRM